MSAGRGLRRGESRDTYGGMIVRYAAAHEVSWAEAHRILTRERRIWLRRLVAALNGHPWPEDWPANPPGSRAG